MREGNLACAWAAAARGSDGEHRRQRVIAILMPRIDVLPPVLCALARMLCGAASRAPARPAVAPC